MTSPTGCVNFLCLLCVILIAWIALSRSNPITTSYGKATAWIDYFPNSSYDNELPDLNFPYSSPSVPELLKQQNYIFDEEAAKKKYPELGMSTPQLIEYHGYPVEEHKVETRDGYILTMFRIPYGKRNTKDDMTKEPVIIQHGLVCSSNDWLLIDSESILPFLLAEDGHDVWLGNARGNNYSMAHKRLTPDQHKFWRFSFHEMGVFDVPAVINYVLRVTQREQLSWIGHSMGCAMFFIAMDEYKSDLQPKIKKMVALAPGVYLSHAKTPLRALALIPDSVMQFVFDLASGGRIIPAKMNGYLHENAYRICGESIPAFMCNNVIFLIAGYDLSQTTERIAAMVASHTPSDTSIRTLEHYLQFVRTGRFQRYGELFTPDYNLTAVVPTLLMYGQNDWLIPPVDVLRTAKMLGSNCETVRVDYTDFNHLDFCYAKDAKELVYDRCVDFLK